MSIYTKNELTDSITAKENNDNKMWTTRVYQGSKLTIALRLPTNEKKQVSLRINQVNFGFKKFGTEYFGNPGASAPCNINVVCPEGNGWQNERNSVALIVVNGQENCTGSLVMNTCNTNIPYFLTANHCLSGNVATWVFQFQTWSATCVGNTGWREDFQFNGATLRANNAASDFALLQLNQTPQSNSGIFYSGWNRNANPPNGSVGLHHPEGDLMKFSRDFDLSGVSSWGGINNHWVSVFEQGTVEPGSSGSALYDMNHRIVGQLHGDQQNQGNYCTQRRGEYGKFDNSWTGGGTNATRLSNWLDPNNSGAMTTNTTNISALINISVSISEPSVMCNSTQEYSVNTTLPVTWASSNTNIATVPPTGNPVTVTRVSNGNVTLTATLNACGNPPIILTKTITIGAPLSPAIGAAEWDRRCGSYLDAISSHPLSATGYRWEYNGGFIQDGTSDTYSVAPMRTNTQVGQTYTNSLVVQARNACGLSASSVTKYYTFGPVTSNCSGGGGQLTVSPNPVVNSLTVSTTDKTKFSSIKIVDHMGITRKVVNLNTVEKTVINVSDLQSGIYHIQAFINGQWTSTTFIKE